MPKSDTSIQYMYHDECGRCPRQKLFFRTPKLGDIKLANNQASSHRTRHVGVNYHSLHHGRRAGKHCLHSVCRDRISARGHADQTSECQATRKACEPPNENWVTFLGDLFWGKSGDLVPSFVGIPVTHSRHEQIGRS